MSFRMGRPDTVFHPSFWIRLAMGTCQSRLIAKIGSAVLSAFKSIARRIKRASGRISRCFTSRWSAFMHLSCFGRGVLEPEALPPSTKPPNEGEKSIRIVLDEKGGCNSECTEGAIPPMQDAPAVTWTQEECSVITESSNEDKDDEADIPADLGKIPIGKVPIHDRCHSSSLNSNTSTTLPEGQANVQEQADTAESGGGSCIEAYQQASPTSITNDNEATCTPLPSGPPTDMDKVTSSNITVHASPLPPVTTELESVLSGASELALDDGANALISPSLEDVTEQKDETFSGLPESVHLRPSPMLESISGLVEVTDRETEVGTPPTQETSPRDSCPVCFERAAKQSRKLAQLLLLRPHLRDTHVVHRTSIAGRPGRYHHMADAGAGVSIIVGEGGLDQGMRVYIRTSHTAVGSVSTPSFVSFESHARSLETHSTNVR
ncbi:hypothetical protein NMY22_g12698 [Coprinellus aureogranulatus]|nr:hypothetical protein NMY22_g12698 [Coprinellus aureogranulatus]